MAKRRPRRRERLHPDVVVRLRSPNQSTRLPGGIDLIVVHSTESHNRPGKSDLVGVGKHFLNPHTDASAHVCVDADGRSARFVADDRKAWHCGYFNSWSLGVEQIGEADDGLGAWKRRQKLVDETARWVALWSIQHGIPIRKGRTRGYRIVRSGVVAHGWLGNAGGDHWDPGRYPFQHLLRRARHYKREILLQRR